MSGEGPGSVQSREQTRAGTGAARGRNADENDKQEEADWGRGFGQSRFIGTGEASVTGSGRDE